jgi:hypothetical protein
MPRRKLTNLEERIRSHKATIDQSLKDCLRTDIPEPSYTFEVGDRCCYGAFDWSGVLEVCDNGKYYKLFSIHWNTNTNKGNYMSYKIHYEVWFRLLPYRTDEENEAIERFEEDDDIFFSYQQRDMRSLIHMTVMEYGIDLEPDYQRGLVWNEDQKISLIDSIFKNIDIGKFTVIKRKWGDNPNKPTTSKLYEMLDGKQRISTLFEFYTSKFKYRGKYFYELHWRDQVHFKNYRISYAECDPLTDEQKYRYFLKLNTTGVPISEEHMERVRELWKQAKTHK